MHTLEQCVSTRQIEQQLLCLVDLLIAHRVYDAHLENQQRAVDLAEQLADGNAFMPPEGVLQMQQLFDVLQKLKSANMITADGYCWTDLLRREIRDLANYYHQLLGNIQSVGGYKYSEKEKKWFIFQHLSFDRDSLLRRKRRRLLNIPLMQT